MDLNADYAYSYLDIGSAYLGLGDAESALESRTLCGAFPGKQSTNVHYRIRYSR